MLANLLDWLNRVHRVTLKRHVWHLCEEKSKIVLGEWVDSHEVDSTTSNPLLACYLLTDSISTMKMSKNTQPSHSKGSGMKRRRSKKSYVLGGVDEHSFH